MGIAEQWTGSAQNPDHWRDTHFEVEGPVVGQMQAVFMDNWIKTSGAVLHGVLLAAGAEIYEYQPTMYHCKVMIVDEYMVSVGSTNFDDRSFRLNDEARHVRQGTGRDLRGGPREVAANDRGDVGVQTLP